MSRLYAYVGPADKLAQREFNRQPIESPGEIEAWLALHAPRREPAAVTYIVDEAGVLWIADRHAEHVACAGGRPVLAAGELFFERTPILRVTEASNQSTGYCPEASSWKPLAAALDRLGLGHPGHFTLACTFRRCPECGQRNLVKDNNFECSVCAGPLPTHWNFAD